MYVCVCHGIKERDVVKAGCNGACRASDVFRQHGVKPKCGRCLPTMRDMVGECAEPGDVCKSPVWHTPTTQPELVHGA